MPVGSEQRRTFVRRGRSHDAPPTQVRRSGDVVPTVPPRLFGYADHPYEFGTDGRQYLDPAPYSTMLGGSLRWIRFLAGLFEPHSMESYRKEVGITAHAKGAQLPLVEEKKLERENIQ